MKLLSALRFLAGGSPLPKTPGATGWLDGSSENQHVLNVSVAAIQVEIDNMVSRTPGIKSGTPHIAGTGVTVRTIVRWYKLGMSAEEIAA